VDTKKFFGELKRRNVYRAAVAYGVVAWFLTQLTTQVFPFFEIPNSAIRFVVIALALGFPIAMCLSWLYELTPEGIVRAEDLDPVKARTARHATGRILDFIIIGVLLLVIGLLIYERGPFRTFAGGSIPAKSIAVLPFENRSEDKANAYVADGIQDEILTNLAKVADLKVISRTSVMLYQSSNPRNLREIGEQLGVAHVLEGSVQRAGNRVRINAQLVDARTDAHLWANTYDRDLADVFAIQSEIAKTIADQLQAKISPSEKAAIEKPPTTNLAAYDLYLRARELYATTTDQVRGKVQLPKAASFLDRAVAADPGFVLAWSFLSQVHGTMYFWGCDRTGSRLDLANAAVQTALRLQPEAGEPHLALATYYYRGFRDYNRARNELAVARKTLPNNADVFFYTGVIDYRCGQWEEATRNLERAFELDPRNVMTVQQLALCYQPQRRYAEEARMWERSLAIIPGDPASRISRAIVESNSKADMKPYETTFAALVAENPSVAPEIDDPFQALRERTATAAARLLTNYSRDGIPYYGINYPHAYWEGVVARWQGDNAKAQAAFTAARNEVEKAADKQPEFAAALSLLGLIDAGLGRKEEAIREGQRACELLPMSKDAVDGVAFVVNLSQIFAWTGETDLAIDQLTKVLKVPNDCHYGELRLHPIWDPLRGNPRFEAIVASLAPKAEPKK
jgi:TolB-like protein/Flp pilus assembly protein TadD